MKREEILEILKMVKEDQALREEFLAALVETLDLRVNPFHPLVFINGRPDIGKGVSIGLFSEVNARGSRIEIGDYCDIASFVSINVSDSHKKALGLDDVIEKKPIIIEKNVFIGSHSVVKGGAHIGHHSVIAAGTVVDGKEIPPYSLIYGNPMEIKPGYYLGRLKSKR